MQPESLQQLSEASRARVAAAASVSARINIGVLGPAASDMQLGHRTWLNLTVCTLTSRTAATKIGLGPRHTDTQSDRQTQTHTQTHRQKDRQTHRHSQTHRHTDRHT